MAITVQMREQVSQLYVALFGRAPDGEGLGYWVGQLDAGKTMVDVANTMYATAPARVLYPSFLTNQEIIGNFYTNVLGRTADAEGLAFWTAKLNAAGATAGSVIAEMINIVANYSGTDPAGLTSQALFNNKVAVAQWYGEQNGNIAGANTVLTAVTSDPASVDAAKTGGAQSGETFMLTKDVEVVTGTSGNDTIRGVVTDASDDTKNTLNQLDEINGGAGTDTLKISNSAAGAIKLPTLNSVEVVELSSTDIASIDTSAYTDVTDLNVIKVGAGKAITATAADATNIKVEAAVTGAGATTVNGGKDVTVKLTGEAGDQSAVKVIVGGTTAAKGAVVVDVAAEKAQDTSAKDVKLNAIEVTGGKTISVTQHVGDSSGLTAGAASKSTHTQGSVTIVADASTTDVTVKQDKAVTGAAGTKGVTAVASVQSVKFVDLAATETVTLTDGTKSLVFTAGAGGALAADVAKAFSNLINGAAIGAVAAGDTQGSGSNTKGVFSGELVGWTSGAASGDTVTFTQATAAATLASAATGGSNKAVTVTQTTAEVTGATAAANVLEVVTGVVKITAGAALKTVTVDGFATSTGGDGIIGTATALDTVKLSNGTSIDVNSADTLNLTLADVTGTVDVKQAKTLNVDVTTTGTTGASTLAAGAATTVKVTGTGKIGDGGTALAVATSIDTVGMTAGTADFKIDGTKTTYAGGAAVDTVTISANQVISKAIDLGAGNDKLDMSAVTTTASVPTATLDGGAGDADTVLLAAAYAAGVDATAFKAKVKNFERLELTAVTANTNVDVGALGFGDYVITNGVTTAKTLTLTNVNSNGTVELGASTADYATGVTVLVKDADVSGHNSDVLNVVATVAAADRNHGTLTVANVETVNITTKDTAPGTVASPTINTSDLVLTADKATSSTIKGNANLDLVLTGSDKLVTVNATDLTGNLTLDAHGKAAMTITGGSGADTIKASVGATAKADVIVGGAGNDILYAGSNGASLTGGAGNDLFMLVNTAGDNTGGGTFAYNTYTTIEDFQAGDLLQLVLDASGPTVAAKFAKLEANVLGAVNSDSYISAVMDQLKTQGGGAVWFKHGSDTYIVADVGANSDGATFVGNEDLIIKLAGVDGANLSFNSDYGTIALI